VKKYICLFTFIYFFLSNQAGFFKILYYHFVQFITRIYITGFIYYWFHINKLFSFDFEKENNALSYGILSTLP